jgi:gliding motility-associated-like protein
MSQNKIIVWVIISIMLFTQNQLVQAQKQNNQWRYGYGGGIDFNFCPPRGTDGGSMSTNEGSASISNRRTGDLLFYNNGVTIWDKNNNPMPNGKNLTGGSTSLSSTSAATIIPAVNDTNLFYIVTIDEQFSDKGLRYSVLDMRLNGGLGDVVSTQKNILLYNTISEKIQVVPNAAKNGYWIISHDNSQSFVVFALTSAGINSTPIISLAGGSQGNGAGHLKVNRQFNKIAMGVVFGGEINLLNFNNTTGVVTNNLTWKSKLANPLIYGIEFSSDGSKLYAANLDKIVQFDISLNNATAISNSYYEVLSGGGFTYQPSSMQLGPNNKIYINNGGSIGCINSPNLSGASCDYENNAVTGLTGGGGYGLPQFVYYLDNDATSPISNAILNKDSCVNKAVQFSLLDSLSIVSVQWNFGDNLNSTTNTSNLKSPLHLYKSPGNYDVKALIKTACGDIEVTKKINIIDCGPKICKASINTLDSCQQKLVQLSVKADSTIKSLNWFFGYDKTRPDNFSTNLKPTYVYPKAGKYNIQLIAQLSCGFDTATKEIEIIDCSPKICKASINTLDSCQQKLVQFSIKADSAIKSVNWFLGYDNTRPDNFSTNLKPTYAYPKAGKYTIRLITQLSCGFDTATKEIEIIDCSPKICKASINTLDSCQQKLVQFSVKADSAIKSVNWFLGYDNTRPDNFSTDLNPTYAYPKAGKYTIQLITELSCGFDTAFKEIEIVDCIVDTTNIQTYLPNVFTPNNDLLNDVFKIISNKNLEQFNLVIYNRWGQEIFNTNNYEQGWNGRYQDNDCPDGVYFYLISYSHKKKNYNTCGTVTLLR